MYLPVISGRVARGLVPGALCLALAACGAAGPGASSSSSKGKADLSFYKGKTVTMIVPSKPGGSFDAWGRLLAPEMAKYLHATVNVRNVPPGNTIVGQNQLASSAPDGLTIGWINGGEDVTEAVKGSTGLTFNPSQIPYVGAVGAGLFSLVAQSNSPYHTFQDLQKATTPIHTLDVTRGTNDLILRTLLGAYGVNAKIITGYESTKDLAAGFLRGDGQLTNEEMLAVQSTIKEGKARALVLSTAVPPQNTDYAQVKNAPTIQQLSQQDPPKTAEGKHAIKTLLRVLSASQAVATPKGVPAPRLAALRQAMQWGMQQPGLKAQALKQSLNPGYTPGPQVQQTLTTALADAKSLKPYLGSSG